MVNIIHLPLSGTQVHEIANDLDDVLRGKRGLLKGDVELQFLVELQSSHRRKIIPLEVEEQSVEKAPRHLERGWLTGTHLAINLEEGLIRRLYLVREQRVADGRDHMDAVHVNDFHFLGLARGKTGKELLGDLFIRREQHFPGFGIDDIPENDPVHEVLAGNGDLGDARGLHFLDRHPGDLGAFLDDRFSGRFIGDRYGRLHSREYVRPDAPRKPVLLDLDILNGIVQAEKVLIRISEGLQEDRRRNLSSPVNANIHNVLHIEFEIKPRSAVGNDPCRIEDLAACVRTSLVVGKECPR